MKKRSINRLENKVLAFHAFDDSPLKYVDSSKEMGKTKLKVSPSESLGDESSAIPVVDEAYAEFVNKKIKKS